MSFRVATDRSDTFRQNPFAPPQLRESWLRRSLQAWYTLARSTLCSTWVGTVGASCPAEGDQDDAQASDDCLADGCVLAARGQLRSRRPRTGGRTSARQWGH